MNNKKSVIEMVLMPLVVALVGIGGTYFITTQQERNAKTSKDAQLESAREMADADRQVKILEIFAEKVASKDQQERILALRLLDALDPALAEKLATAVKQGEPEQSEVRKVADQVAEEAKTSLERRAIILIRNLFSDDPQVRKAAAQDLIQRWRNESNIVLMLVDFANQNMDNKNGVYNTVVVLSEFSDQALEVHKQKVLNFLKRARAIGSKTEAKSNALIRRLGE